MINLKGKNTLNNISEEDLIELGILLKILMINICNKKLPYGVMVAHDILDVIV